MATPGAKKDGVARVASRAESIEPINARQVLIIDDGVAVRQTLQSALHGLGCAFTEARDGKAALKVLAEGMYDVTFLDLMLPDLSGIEVLRIAREASAGLGKVIVLTHHFEDATRQQAFELGAFRYMRKDPINQQAIRQAFADAVCNTVAPSAKPTRSDRIARPPAQVREGPISHGSNPIRVSSTARRRLSPKQPRDLAQFRALMKEAPVAHFYVVLLGLQAFDWTELMRIAARGLSYEALDHFQRNTGLPLDKLLDWLQISPRTLTRRKQQRRFLPEESDRLLRASRVFGRALELFEGDRDAASEWMISSQPALGGEAPIDVARTELGSREVENLVGRVEHGVYS